MVCVDFSLIGYDPKVFHLLTEIAMSIADEGGREVMWKMILWIKIEEINNIFDLCNYTSEKFV